MKYKILRDDYVYAISYSIVFINNFTHQRRFYYQYMIIETNCLEYRYEDDRYTLMNIGGLYVIEEELEFLYKLLNNINKTINRIRYLVQFLHNEPNLEFIDKYELPEDKTQVIDDILHILNISEVIKLLERRLI